jgi:cell division control protein 45
MIQGSPSVYLSSMVYLPPPHLSTPTRPSYAEAYTQILTVHRSSPLTSASGVIIACATDVDAICAARMLADLLKQDDVMHRIIPVGGMNEFALLREDLRLYSEVRTILSYFGLPKI